MAELKNQVYLGGDNFVTQMQSKLTALQAGTDADLTEVPRVQCRLATFTLQDIMDKNLDRNTFEYCLYYLLENDEIVFDFYARYKNKNVGRRLILLDFYYVLYLSN